MDTPTIGMTIRRHRTRLGLKQEDLAERLGLTKDGQPHISDIERGKTAIPGLAEIARIEEALGLSRGQILIETGYVELPTTARQMLSMDPALTIERREIVLDLYDAQARRSSAELDGPALSTAANTSPTAATRRRKSANS